MKKQINILLIKMAGDRIWYVVFALFTPFQLKHPFHLTKKAYHYGMIRMFIVKRNRVMIVMTYDTWLE
ncbi:hypothetical protein ACFWDG_25435 [Peribacillus sp. NPDC060186]